MGKRRSPPSRRRSSVTEGVTGDTSAVAEHLHEAGRVRRDGGNRGDSSRARRLVLPAHWSVSSPPRGLPLCTLFVHRTKDKRQAAFADQLPDVLQLVTTALRSGYGLTKRWSPLRRRPRRAGAKRVRPRTGRDADGARFVRLDARTGRADGEQGPGLGGLGDRHQPRDGWQPVGDLNTVSTTIRGRGSESPARCAR